MIFGYKIEELYQSLVSTNDTTSFDNIRWFHEIKTDDKLWGRFGKNDLHYFIDITDIGVATYHLNSKKTTFYNTKGLEQRQILSYYIHHLVPFILSLRGDLILHGGSFIRNQQAFVYLGEQGSGKSTLGLQLLQLQQMVLADDSVKIKMNPGCFEILSGPNTIRINNDLPIKLTKNFEFTHSYFNKKLMLLPLEKITDRPYHLRALFLLENAELFSIDQLKPSEAFPYLLKNVFRLDTENQQLLRHEFRSLNDLLSHVPCYLIHWPQNFKNLENNTKNILNFIDIDINKRNSKLIQI
ncbi:MAG: hypothetical protein KDD40_09780 [Bdellovibrionales bacterium]|nr:hypothetical protein [Bdellovibrionales bacterium]